MSFDRYVVIGNPIAHSRSPIIHQAFATATGQALTYERCLAPLNDFAETVAELRRQGVRGANVTVPFKEEAFGLCDDVSEGAQLAGAVNTLVFSDRINGHNTDGVGLVRDIQSNLGIELRDKRVLILGAGGATRGVIAPLLDAGAARVDVWNRHAERAQRLIDDLKHDARVARHCGAVTARELAAGSHEVVINATAAGHRGERPALDDGVLRKAILAYDLSYGSAANPFLQWTRARVERVSDGLGMLVEQAAEAFFIWRGIRPATAPVLSMLRTTI